VFGGEAADRVFLPEFTELDIHGKQGPQQAHAATVVGVSCQRNAELSDQGARFAVPVDEQAGAAGLGEGQPQDVALGGGPLVETAEQSAQLHALGCEYAQGFHFSRAVDAMEAGRLIAAQPWRRLDVRTITAGKLERCEAS